MLVVANDNSDKSRRGFVDRYLEIVLHRVQVVGSETGETLLGLTQNGQDWTNLLILDRLSKQKFVQSA